MYNNTQVLSFPLSMEGITYPQQENRISLPWNSLPPDLILRIFSCFTPFMLATLSLVSKSDYALVNQDYIWDSMAANLYLPHDLEVAKQTECSIKEICKAILVTSRIGHEKLMLLNDLSLTPRNPYFIARIQQFQPQQYSLLAPLAVRDLMKQSDTIDLIISKGFDQLDPIAQQKDVQIVHHIAQQKVGKTTFDIINYTDYVVSFNEKRILQINGKITNESFTADNCQLIVYIYKNIFHITHKDKGKMQIFDIKCRMHALRNAENAEMIDDFYG